MATQIPLASFTKALARLLDETFEQVQGIYLDRGTSLFETLTRSPPRKPPARCRRPARASPRRWSMCASTWRCLRATRGEAVGQIDWGASWRLTSVTHEEWDALKGRLRDAHRDIVAVIGDAETWADENAIGGSLAVVVHTAYHLGEIRQALCTIKR